MLWLFCLSSYIWFQLRAHAPMYGLLHVGTRGHTHASIVDQVRIPCGFNEVPRKVMGWPELGRCLTK